jgi:hypothetical protein
MFFALPALGGWLTFNYVIFSPQFRSLKAKTFSIQAQNATQTTRVAARIATSDRIRLGRK